MHPHPEGVTPRNILFGYDEGLGISPEHLDYIKRSHVIQSRISPTPCYLLQKASGGIPIGYSGKQISALDSDFVNDGTQYRLILWEGGSNHPDTRPYVSGGLGNIFIYQSGSPLTRVISVDDLRANNEFAVVENNTVIPNQVDIVFNPGYNPVGGMITYHYFTWEAGINDLSVQRGDSSTQSVFGWKQYLNSRSDLYQRQNQILVRFPINLRDVTITDEGKVVLENRDSWMIWTPYVNDFDFLILDSADSPDGIEYRYEIVNSRDSVVQRQLTLQFFKLNLLELTDDRYKIPFKRVA